MASVWYVTRDEVKAALDMRNTARADPKIDRNIESCSRQVEAILHRRFYPEIATRYFPWPDSVDEPGTLWLNDSELVSATTITSGGVTIAAGTGYNLEPNQWGPPYNRVEILRSGTASFGGGYGQRDVAITGVFGYQNDETPGPVLAGAIATTSTTALTTGAGNVSVGALIRVDSERMIVTARSSVTTGQTLTGALLAANNGTTVTVADGTALAIGETILVDAERMTIDDIAGNTLVVRRAVDGTVLATHSIGATLYAPRRLTVARGQLGTTAATHADASTVQLFVFPGPVRAFTMALTMDTIEQESAAYARTTGSGNSIRDTGGRGLEIARKTAITAVGRFGRTAAI